MTERPPAADPGASAASGPLRFYLGTGNVAWLGRELFADVPLCLSRNRLAHRKTFPRAVGNWVLDSGAFTMLQRHGRWTLTPGQYVDQVRRIIDAVGVMPDWIAGMDLMCEPFVIHGRRDVDPRSSQWFHGTRDLRGLRPGDPEPDVDEAVRIHQELTVLNTMVLLEAAPDLPWLPVLQGWSADSYLRCARWYELLGVDLPSFPAVGLGSVCRRQATAEIGQIAAPLAARGIRLHGFGVKRTGLLRYGHLFVSADSQAWSMAAMRKRLPGCVHHSPNCQNCPDFALDWRARLLEKLAEPRPVRRSRESVDSSADRLF